jgi:hypothetical protein
LAGPDRAGAAVAGTPAWPGSRTFLAWLLPAIPLTETRGSALQADTTITTAAIAAAIQMASLEGRRIVRRK